MAQASIKIGASMSEYQSAMKAAVASMKELSSQYSLAAANAKLYGTKSDALKAKISELTQKMDVQKTKVADCKTHYETLTTRLDNNKKKSEELKTKVAELSRAYEESKEATGENSEETKKLKTELDKAEKQLATTEAQTTKYEAAVKKQGAAVTQAEADLANMEVQLRDVNAELARQKFDEYAEKAGKVGQAVQTAGQHMMKVTTAIGGVAAASVMVAANFEQQMSKVQAISGATAEETDKLTESARQWGRDTKYSATEAGEAFEYMALAGWKTDDMLEGIGGILNLAAASAMDLGTASDIVTDYLTAFGLSAKDAGKFADEMAYAMSHSNTTTEALGEAYKNCAATAASMGYSVEETTAVLMTMANAGVKGGEAGTALNAIMTRLATDTKGCATELAKYGVEVYDAQGNMNSLSSILTGVRGVWNNLTDEQQANLAKTIAGTNQFSALQTIMSGLSDEAIASGMSFSDYAEALQNCDGTASDMAATMQDNLLGRLTQLKSKLEDIGITVGNALLADHMYMPMYGGSYDGAKLRSLSGKKLDCNTNAQTEISRAAANGTGWTIISWSRRNLIESLLTLISKSENFQAKFGQGVCSTYVNDSSKDYGKVVTGTLDTKGQFFGYNDGTHEVKAFYCEKLWGNTHWEAYRTEVATVERNKLKSG